MRREEKECLMATTANWGRCLPTTDLRQLLYLTNKNQPASGSGRCNPANKRGLARGGGNDDNVQHDDDNEDNMMDDRQRRHNNQILLHGRGRRKMVAAHGRQTMDDNSDDNDEGKFLGEEGGRKHNDRGTKE